MPESTDPKAIAERLIPKPEFDFALSIAAVHAQMFEQMLTLGLTVQARLIIPASDQPRAAGRSIDAPDYAACALVRAVRDLSLASERIMNQAKQASLWQTSNHFKSSDIDRMQEIAEAVALRAIEPLAKPQLPPAETQAAETGSPDPDAKTLPFPPRRARH